MSTVVGLHTLKPGQPPMDFFALLSDKTNNRTRAGKPFFTCHFRNRHRTVETAVWHDSPLYSECETDWQTGTIYKIRGCYREHETYGAVIDIVRIRPVCKTDTDDGFNERDFITCSQFDSDEMLGLLRTVAEEEIQNVPLQKLVLALLTTHAETIKKIPATLKHFYPYPGGWLEHVLNTTHSCIRLVDWYLARYPKRPPLNRDLVIAGALLHDIGRTVEWEAGNPGERLQETVAGRLIGPLPLARELIGNAAAGIADLDANLLLMLEHLVLSHLALPEWGSPRLPAIAEVLIIHHADDLDAKLEMFSRCLENDISDGPFTERDTILKQRLLKRPIDQKGQGDCD